MVESPAAGPVGSDVPASGDAGPSLGRSVLLGIGLAIGIAAISSFLIAIPFWTLASFESHGLDRPVVRTGLFRIALPVGALIGIVSATMIARWLHHGGRWTADDGGDRYSTR